uniref:glutathione transferase n=1 Tax=Culicoides sonorensis TaxID=179676 RepID=A0A336LSK7_CULSO
MKLYAVNDGPPSLAVRMLLKLLKIEHELIDVDYCAGEHMTEEYAKMNPQKEIPVLDDGFYLSESVAILQYLMDKYAPDNELYPKDPVKRALVNHRLCFNLAYFYPAVGEYSMAPIFWDFQRTPEGLKKLNICLNTFETYLKTTNTKYVAGNQLTIADFPLVTSMVCLEAIKFKLDSFPLIKTWYETFKKEYPALWEICAEGMKVIEHFEKNPPDLTHLNHPLFPAKKLK